jgi:hypothetical protein
MEADDFDKLSGRFWNRKTGVMDTLVLFGFRCKSLKYRRLTEK